MNVLFICHRVPFPPLAGSKVRAFNIIRHLHEQGHRVTVASLARNSEEFDEARALRHHCEKLIVEIIPSPVASARMLAWLPTAHPSSFAYFYSAGLARRLRAELATNSHELIFVHSSSMGPYVARVQSGLKILDYCDVDSQKWRDYARFKPLPLSVGYWLEAVKLERVEARLARDFDLCTCATASELEGLRALGVSAACDWFPNGVDCELYQPDPEYDDNLIVFVGRMDYYPNERAVIDFCRGVLPALQRRRPGLRFDIVGAEPSRRVRELGRLHGVRATGFVNDVRPYVTRAALTVAPLDIARGTQNKVLESMAMGVPVVCSAVVARGVDAVPEQHLLCASTSEQTVQAIERILDSAALRARLAIAGRQRMLTNHNWRSSMARLDGQIATAFERRATIVRGPDVRFSSAAP